MEGYKEYTKTGSQWMRPYVPGEDMGNISLAYYDTPEEGGMIAKNTITGHKWYVSKQCAKTYMEVQLMCSGTVNKETR